MKSDFDYFIENHDDLFEKYPNKYIAIYNCEVISCADSFDDAMYSAIEQGHDVGTFIVQLCTEGSADYTQTFMTRVVFA